MSHEDETRELTDADRHLLEFVRKLEGNSLEQLESAAKQLITLVTSLLGLFLGILAFKDAPTYLAYWDVKLLAGLALLAFLLTLFFALAAVLPREYRVADLNSMRLALITMLRRKRNALRAATLAFGISVTLIFLLALDILLRL